jgi:hypothetical protein
LWPLDDTHNVRDYVALNKAILSSPAGKKGRAGILGKTDPSIYKKPFQKDTSKLLLLRG